MSRAADDVLVSPGTSTEPVFRQVSERNRWQVFRTTLPEYSPSGVLFTLAAKVGLYAFVEKKTPSRHGV